MGYRPNQPRPAPPTEPWSTSRVVHVVVGLLGAVWVLGVLTGLLSTDLAPVFTGVIGGLVGWQLLFGRSGRVTALPDPRKFARELQRHQIATELAEDHEKTAWLAKTIALELENGIDPDPDYARQIDELTARVKARTALLRKMDDDERAEAEAAKPAVPRQAPHPPRPPAGRGAGSEGFIAPYARDWLHQPLLAADPELLSGKERDELEQVIVRRMTTAEPVRILTGPSAVVRRRHICTTVDCNGVDSPHCRMSTPCTCMQPGRGWRTCEQHPEISPL